MKRYLITTADERTWKFDRPVLFLGEWCRLYARRSVWERMDAVVAEPFGLQPGQKERDIGHVQALAGKLLKELADALNAIHGTAHGPRYWNILLGHWLQRYVAVMFNRYFTLEQALKNHAVSSTTVFDATDYSLVTADSDAFVWACVDDVWNHILYSNILRHWGGVTPEPARLREAVSDRLRSAASQAARTPTIKRVVLNAVRRILPMFSTKHDAFVINSYLPRAQEIALHMLLGQCPQFWRSPQWNVVAPDPAQRRGLGLDATNHEGFERHIRKQLPELLPTCYLEGYQGLVRQAESLPWPPKPQFIFTSNNFDADELFKVWTGSKIEKGIPYFTGQHGNNYGTATGSQYWPELVTCDKFLTWGWTNGDPKLVRAFNFKTAGRDLRRAKATGGLLLIELRIPPRISAWDSHYEFGIYQEEQFRFVAALPARVQRALTVRLHAEYKRHAWSDEQRWKDRSPHTKIDTGDASIWTLIARSRLVVHSYDSTGILETLALNIPTICFWHGGLDHLLPSARPYYEMLASAGILAYTPERAAEMIASHWDDINEWWENSDVQRARNAFCAQYSRPEKHPVRAMRKLLVQNT